MSPACWPFLRRPRVDDRRSLFPIIADAATLLAVIGGTSEQRILLSGMLGTGKSTLAAHLARVLEMAGHRVDSSAADPGSPPFGPPGAVSYSRTIAL